MKKLIIILIISNIIIFQLHSSENESEPKAEPKYVNGKNYLKINDRLDTSGQPSLESLQNINQKDYELVINLAPPLSQGSLLQEGGLVAQTGARYVNIPVDWNNPSYADFEFFSHVLNASGHKKVLIHCQINMRGSLFTFLYRVVHQDIDPESAHEQLTEVWTPSEQWLAFAQMVLKKHQIEYTFL